MQPTRVIRSAIVLKPSTLLNFHQALRKRKYRILFSPKRGRKPGPKAPSRELIDAIVNTKQRNPSWGCPRIAQQLALAFGVSIGKDIVRRVLANHYRPKLDSCGPSWLTFLGEMKDSLRSMDLFRCESATRRTHWIWSSWINTRAASSASAFTPEPSMGSQLPDVQPGHWGPLDMPKYLSSDQDPLFRLSDGKPICESWGWPKSNGAQCSTVPSICRTVDRDDSQGILKSYAVLGDGGSRERAARVPELLQQASYAYGTGGRTPQDTNVLLPAPGSIPMGGNPTVGVSIRHR